MGCGCGKASPAVEYQVTMPDGEVRTTTSHVQATQWAAKGGVLQEKAKA
jgi:hypothetical protein